MTKSFSFLCLVGAAILSIFFLSLSSFSNSAQTEDDCSSSSGSKPLYGFVLSTMAGMMTFIGAMTVYFPIPKQHMRQTSCFCLASASGVMAFVSLVEVFHEAKSHFEEVFKGDLGLIYACLSFFVGWGLARAMDNLLHAYLDPQVETQCPSAFLEKGSPQNEEEMAQRKFEADTFRLMRVGWFTALALTVHNIPEGLLTYVSAQSANPTIGLGIAVAIGMHNIPEGFAVAFPIMIATGSKLKGMSYAAITGFAEPLGALLGYLFINLSDESSNHKIFGWLFGITAGIMTQVSISSLLLEAARYDPGDKIVSRAWVFGAAVIALSLVVIQVTDKCSKDEAEFCSKWQSVCS